MYFNIITRSFILFLIIFMLTLISGHIESVYADTTYIQSYKASSTSLCGSSQGNSIFNYLCLEKFSHLKSGERIKNGGIMGTSGDNVNANLFLYKDDAPMAHYINKINNYKTFTYQTNTIEAEQFSRLPPLKKITSIGTFVGTATSCGSNSPSPYQMGIYTNTDTGTPGTLLFNSTIVNTPCSSGQVVTFNTNVIIPQSGTVWIALVMPFNSGSQGGFVDTDNSNPDIGISSLLGSYTCCSTNMPATFGLATAGADSSYMQLTYNDVNMSGNAGSRFDSTGMPLVSGIVTGNFDSNATVPSDGNVWLGIYGVSSGVAQQVLTANTTGISTDITKAFAMSGGNAFVNPPNLFNAYSLVNNTSFAPYSQLTLSDSNISITPTSGVTGTQVTISGKNFTANSSLNFKIDKTVLTTTPSSVTTDHLGEFNSTTFLIPSISAGSHIINVTDASNNWAVAYFTVNGVGKVNFSEWLNDNSAQIISGKVIQSSNVSNTITINLNGTGWATFSPSLGTPYNYTFIDNSNNFVVYKLINYIVNLSNVNKYIFTWEIPFNCVSPFTGYQSDFIIQNNDTDGHHITGVQGPSCINTNELKYNVTFTANGQSSNSYNSLTRITMGSAIFSANPLNFTINNSKITTIQTTGVNMLTNTYLVGTGLQTKTLDYDILLQKTGSTVGGAGGTGQQLYVTTNSSCFAGVFNPLTNSCQFGPVSVTVTSPPAIVSTTSSNTTTINIQCQGAPYLTITNVNLGSNPLGFQIVGLPTTVNCGQNSSTPSSCPVGTTLQNGECITSATCPLANQLSNGQCVGPVSCPSGSSQINGQCIIPATCSGGTQPIDGICPVNGTITIQAPPTNSSLACSFTNPIACITGSSQSEPATLTGVTPDGQSVAIKTVLTSLTNPELNNVSIVMIGLIIAAAIGGVVYRYVLKKEKSSSRKPRKSNGKKGNIEKFNSNLRKK